MAHFPAFSLRHHCVSEIAPQVGIRLAKGGFEFKPQCHCPYRVPLSRSLPWNHATYDAGVTIGVGAAGRPAIPPSPEAIKIKPSTMETAFRKVGQTWDEVISSNEILVLQIVSSQGWVYTALEAWTVDGQIFSHHQNW